MTGTHKEAPGPGRGGGGGGAGGAGGASTGYFTTSPTAASALARLLAKLEEMGLRPICRNGSWAAYCPGHDDGRRRGLSIREAEDGRVLVYCHHGLPTEEVLAALGLSWGDLFPPGQRHSGSDRGQQRQQQAQKLDDPLAWWASRCGLPAEFVRRLPLEARDGAVAFTWPELETIKLRTPGVKGWWQPPDGPRPPLWPALPDEAPPVLVLTEGESDATVAAYIVEALGLKERAFAVAATKGAAARPDAALLWELVAKGFRALLLVPDADEVGQKWAQAWEEAARQAGMVAQSFDLVGLGLVAPSLGEKDLRDAYRRQSVRVMAALREAIEGLAQRAGARGAEKVSAEYKGGGFGRNDFSARPPAPCPAPGHHRLGAPWLPAQGGSHTALLQAQTRQDHPHCPHRPGAPPGRRGHRAAGRQGGQGGLPVGGAAPPLRRPTPRPGAGQRPPPGGLPAPGPPASP